MYFGIDVIQFYVCVSGVGLLGEWAETIKRNNKATFSRPRKLRGRGLKVVEEGKTVSVTGPDGTIVMFSVKKFSLSPKALVFD